MAAKLESRSETNGVAPEDFLRHYRAIHDAKRAKEEAAAAYQAARHSAKAAGVDMDAMKIVEHLSSLDDADAELRMRETLRYAAWMGLEIGTQADMFGDAPEIELVGKVSAQHAEWKAEQDGYKAGKGGEPRDNCPIAATSPLHPAWNRGWREGAEFRATQAPTGE